MSPDAAFLLLDPVRSRPLEVSFSSHTLTQVALGRFCAAALFLRDRYNPRIDKALAFGGQGSSASP